MKTNLKWRIKMFEIIDTLKVETINGISEELIFEIADYFENKADNFYAYVDLETIIEDNKESHFLEKKLSRELTKLMTFVKKKKIQYFNVLRY